MEAPEEYEFNDVHKPFATFVFRYRSLGQFGIQRLTLLSTDLC